MGARVGSVGEYLAEQRRHAQLSLRQLSDLAGVSNPYLSQIERGLRKPSADVLQQLAKALRISAETLYVRAGILEAREGDTDLVTEIRRDPWINEEQKKTLVQIYESFRAERRAAGFDADVIPNAAHAAALAALRETDEAAERRTSGDPESEALAGR